jgi:hypothetical protein
MKSHFLMNLWIATTKPVPVMKTFYQTSLVVVLFGMMTTMSSLFFSCDAEGWGGEFCEIQTNGFSWCGMSRRHLS